MQQKITILFFALCACFLTAFGQENNGFCGNTYKDQMAQMNRYKANLKAAKSFPVYSRNSTTYIPIQFHLVTRNNGTGGIQVTDVLEQLCHLNNQFGEFGIKFYQAAAPKYLANDVVYSDHSITSGQFKMRQVSDRNALNIWVVDCVNIGGGCIAGDNRVTLGYFDNTNDWVVMKKNQITGVNNTLAHEIGHFFSLFHPHLGWDSDPYDINKHGNPAPERAPSGGKTELMNGSNCEEAGDMLCDTPPDYNFALSWIGCNFSADIKDPKGVKVEPDESLIMSYFNDECTSKFTETQVAMMLADINSSARNFLTNNNYTPVADEITEMPILTAPIESSVTAAYNKVTLQWQHVTGADSYLVEVDRSAGFNIDRLQYVVFDNKLLLEDVLEADKNYRWRVTPINASYTCASPSETQKFRTGISTSVATIASINDWSIQPNPLTEGANLTLEVNAKKSFTANVKIFNLTGQLIDNQPAKRFTNGNTRLQLTIPTLTKGIYFVTLENEEGVLNKKLVVQ